MGYVNQKRCTWLSDKTWKLVEEGVYLNEISPNETKAAKDLQEQYGAKDKGCQEKFPTEQTQSYRRNS